MLSRSNHSPLTLLRSLEPAWEPGWDPPWELGWELGVLELEELPLLVLCSGLSTMGSVLRRSGLLWEHKPEEHPQMVLQAPPRLQSLPTLSVTAGRGEDTSSAGEDRAEVFSPAAIEPENPLKPMGAESGTQHLYGGGSQL